MQNLGKAKHLLNQTLLQNVESCSFTDFIAEKTSGVISFNQYIASFGTSPTYNDCKMTVKENSLSLTSRVEHISMIHEAF